MVSEFIKVYDGNASFRHHNYKLISVPRHTSVEQLVAAVMWVFHLTGDPGTTLGWFRTVPQQVGHDPHGSRLGFRAVGHSSARGQEK